MVAGAAAPEEARHLGRDGGVQHPRGNLEKNHGIHGSFGNLFNLFDDFGDFPDFEKVEITPVFVTECQRVSLSLCWSQSKELTSGSLHFKWQDLQSDSTRSTAKRWIEAMHTHGVAMVSGRVLMVSGWGEVTGSVFFSAT